VADNVRGAVKGLRAGGSAEALEVADWMEAGLGERDGAADNSGSKA
jgi:hypothetical protein